MFTTWLIYLSVACGATVLVARKNRLRETTLMAPWCWSFGSFLSIAVVQVAIDFAIADPSRLSAWRFLAATSTLCPGIALLGAKRPQNRGWQWIVASLWLIIALPAMQQLALRNVGLLEIHPARGWFMVGLILFCLVNSLFSRYGGAALLAGCGQFGMLGPFLPLPFPFNSSTAWSWGVMGLSAAVPLAVASARFGRTQRPFDTLWLDFRDGFGLVWSLRLMEQMNSVAKSNGWDVALHWGGFRALNGSAEWPMSPEQTRILRQSMLNLLRRFVSKDWIASRLGGDE